MGTAEQIKENIWVIFVKFFDGTAKATVLVAFHIANTDTAGIALGGLFCLFDGDSGSFQDGSGFF